MFIFSFELMLYTKPLQISAHTPNKTSSMKRWLFIEDEKKFVKSHRISKAGIPKCGLTQCKNYVHKNSHMLCNENSVKPTVLVNQNCKLISRNFFKMCAEIIFRKFILAYFLTKISWNHLLHFQIIYSQRSKRKINCATFLNFAMAISSKHWN